VVKPRTLAGQRAPQARAQQRGIAEPFNKALM